jgi:hypothetical protein
MTWKPSALRVTSASIAVLAFAPVCRSENKGLCPPAPPLSAKTAHSASANPGSITLLAVISDTGYVCSARVLHGLDNETNKKFETAALAWHFDPAQKNGRPVPVVVTIDVKYHTTSDGQVVAEQPQSPRTAKGEAKGTQ